VPYMTSLIGLKACKMLIWLHNSLIYLKLEASETVFHVLLADYCTCGLMVKWVVYP
jgi:hypothetical protein